VAARGADPLAHPVDRGIELRRRRGARRSDLERLQGAGSAWDDVRQVRESDKILALLESETSRLQNLIHRYINQPSPDLFAEILLLREAVLGTLTTRAATTRCCQGRSSGSNTSPTVSSTVWRIARRAGHHHQDL
jgi:hypothetical protein